MVIFTLTPLQEPSWLIRKNFPWWEPAEPYNPPDVKYILSDHDVKDSESNIDHSGLIDGFNRKGYQRGGRIYNSNCINCHGNKDIEGSIPMSLKFWSQPFKAGFDPFSMYQSILRLRSDTFLLLEPGRKVLHK